MPTISDGQCDGIWNCPEHRADGGDCRATNGAGWHVETGSCDPSLHAIDGDECQENNPWLSISEGTHHQLVLDSTGNVYTGVGERTAMFSALTPADEPADDHLVLENRFNLQNDWFSCTTSQNSLSFWHSNELKLSMTSDGRVWAAGAAGSGGYLNDNNSTASGSNSTINLPSQCIDPGVDFSTLHNTWKHLIAHGTGQVGRVCLSKACSNDPNSTSIGNWDIFEFKGEHCDNWDLYFFLGDGLKFVVRSDGGWWSSHNGRFLAKVPFKHLEFNGGSVSIEEVTANVAVSGTYSIWVNGEYEGYGGDTADPDQPPEVEETKFEARCRENEFVITIEASCARESCCFMIFQADVPRAPECTDQHHLRLVSSPDVWKCASRKTVDQTCHELGLAGQAVPCWAQTDFDDTGPSWSRPISYGHGDDISGLNYTKDAEWPSRMDSWHKEAEWTWLDSETSENWVVCRGRWIQGANGLSPGSLPVPLTGAGSSLTVTLAIVLIGIVVVCVALALRVQSVHNRKFEQPMLGHFTVDYETQVDNAVHDSIISRFGDDEAAIQSFLESSSLENLELGSIIGRGSSSVVYKAAWRGQQVALKQLLQVPEASNEAILQVLEEFAAEIKIMAKLQHPNVVSLYAQFQFVPLTGYTKRRVYKTNLLRCRSNILGSLQVQNAS